MMQAAEPAAIERQYGKCRVRLCFSEKDVPDAEEHLLDLIMQAYLQRVMPDGT